MDVDVNLTGAKKQGEIIVCHWIFKQLFPFFLPLLILALFPTIEIKHAVADPAIEDLEDQNFQQLDSVAVQNLKKFRRLHLSVITYPL